MKEEVLANGVIVREDFSERAAVEQILEEWAMRTSGKSSLDEESSSCKSSEPLPVRGRAGRPEWTEGSEYRVTGHMCHRETKMQRQTRTVLGSTMRTFDFYSEGHAEPAHSVDQRNSWNCVDCELLIKWLGENDLPNPFVLVSQVWWRKLLTLALSHSDILSLLG